ncbi:chemotaxis protein CheA [Candidatus Halocynthiibacter alkanivorans]|uniref:chemotaxis protein CheA n=1 Tax=Candidatus Halocynthiibacter alkanivorans TaxID=2267619 RepID=UPI000DF3B31D|nr:chemotaxis protein CheA [Candidatus Halocynthiibacter alkanivorans]
MGSPESTFIQEAKDHLQILEEVLLELENTPDNSEHVDAAFRALHTLKGSGSMFGFGELAGFTHHFEDAFDQLREGRAKVSPELIAVSLDSRDHLASLLDLGPDTEAPDALRAVGDVLLARLAKLKGTPIKGTAEGAHEVPAPVSEVADQNVPSRWFISFSPEPAALKNGFRPDLLWDELAQLGDLQLTCFDDRIPALEDLETGECYLRWEMELNANVPRDRIEDVFIFCMDAEITIKTLDEEAAVEDLNPAQGVDDPTKTPDKAATTPATATKSESVRVDARRLDDLMDQLGELVIAQARLKSISDTLDDPRLETTVEEIDTLVTGLRDTTLSIRMLPVSMVFSKFRRVIRDLSVELDKPAQLITEGGETEVDKNIIDCLTEPLVHMIRNSVDHGVEDAATRKAAGKPDMATIHLSASQSGGEVLISIKDDGGGLNADAIRVRAIERGMISEDQEVSTEALYQLIFEPGFSTAQNLSSVSGRGVGMDAVRRVVDDLRGSIDVKSTPGQGTEVILRLPLTLAIIDGLLVDVDGDKFVLPLSSVEECVDLPESENQREDGRTILRIRDQLVPYLSLDNLFGYTPSAVERRRVAIVKADGQRVGLVVDDVLGQLQTVIKPLSPFHRSVEELAGATILGDGSIALVLDVNALVRRASSTLIAA